MKAPHQSTPRPSGPAIAPHGSKGASRIKAQSLLESQPDDAAPFAARVRDALAWRWGTQVAAQIITWTSTILVVRLLEPSDYGLFAMTQVVLTALAFLNGQSFATSLVQTDRIDERRVGQIFGLLLVSNSALALTQLCLAPFAAAYFGEPLVADMLRIQAVIFLTVPFTALPSELLARRLQFRRQGQINMASAAIGAALALYLAWRGAGVWALVYAPIAMFASRAVGLSFAAKLRIKPIFDPRGAWDLVTFGGTLTICQLFWIIQSQSDIVIAGRMLSTYDLGLYSEALFLTLIVTGRFIPPVNEVALAAYSELHRAGKPLAGYFLKTARSVMIVCAPVYIGLALTSEPAVLTLFGEKWAGIVPIVGGIALVMPAFALHLICAPVTNAMGKLRIYLSTSLAGAILMPIAFWWGAQAEGMMGLVHAWWVAAPILCAITLTLTLRAINLPALRLIREIAPIALGCGIMVIAVLALQSVLPDLAPWWELAASAAAGAIVYVGFCWLFLREIIQEAASLLRGRAPQA